MINLVLQTAGGKRMRISNVKIGIQAVALIILLVAGMTSNVATLMVVGILCSCFVFMNANEIVASMLFFYPMYCLFKFNGVGVSYYNILIIMSIICLMFKPDINQRKLSAFPVRIKKNVVWLVIFCGYALFISLINGQTSAVSSVILDLFIPLLLVGVVVGRKDIQITTIIYAFSLGIICAGIVGSGLLPVNNLDAYIDTNAYRIAGVRLIRLQGVTVNPNYYSTDVNLAIAGLLALPPMYQRKMKNTEWVLVGLLVVFGIMSLSKSFFLGLVATVGFLALFSGDLKKFASVIVGLLAAGTIIVILHMQENAYILAIFDRFSDGTDSMESLTSSRSVIWLSYLKYMFVENPLSVVIGNGVAGGPLASIGRSSHSFYIETVYYLGIAGVALWFGYLRNSIQKVKRKRIQYLPLAVFLVRAVAINLLLREAMMIYLIVMMLYLKASNKDTASGMCIGQLQQND